MLLCKHTMDMTWRLVTIQAIGSKMKSQSLRLTRVSEDGWLFWMNLWWKGLFECKCLHAWLEEIIKREDSIWWSHWPIGIDSQPPVAIGLVWNHWSYWNKTNQLLYSSISQGYVFFLLNTPILSFHLF